MIAKLVSVTPDAEKTMIYIARVSNPNNQNNQEYAKLLRHCIDEGHWSVFDQADMTVEVNTSIAMAMQILRHYSFKFQQFSQRYADVTHLQIEIPVPSLRRQDKKNRQNSTDDLPKDVKARLEEKMRQHFSEAIKLYCEMLQNDVAKESARFVLPEATMTRMYMKGSCRSWIHYLATRTKVSTQKEHRDVANAIMRIFCEVFPTVAEAMEWKRLATTP